MSVTLDSLLNITKSITGTAGAALTALVATDVIPIPESWRGAAVATGVALTGFSVWLASNKDAIESGAGEVADGLEVVCPAWDPAVDRFLDREAPAADPDAPKHAVTAPTGEPVTAAPSL